MIYLARQINKYSTKVLANVGARAHKNDHYFKDLVFENVDIYLHPSVSCHILSRGRRHALAQRASRVSSICEGLG
jgi:hypothetical protein